MELPPRARFRHALAAEETVAAYHYLVEALAEHRRTLADAGELSAIRADIIDRELERLTATGEEMVRDLEDQRQSIAEAGQYAAFVIARQEAGLAPL